MAGTGKQKGTAQMQNTILNHSKNSKSLKTEMEIA